MPVRQSLKTRADVLELIDFAQDRLKRHGYTALAEKPYGSPLTRSSFNQNFPTILPSLMGVRRRCLTVGITNISKPAIRKMSPMLKRHNAAWSASISHCPWPLTFQIGAAGSNVGEIPTAGMTPPFSNVTQALEVIPSKIRNPPLTLALTM